VHLAGAFGDKTRPGEGEAVAVEAAVAQQIEILGPAVVVIIRDGAGGAALHVAGRLGKGIPDRDAAAIALAAFDLVGGGGSAEDEVGAKILAFNAEHASSRGRFSMAPAGSRHGNDAAAYRPHRR